MMKKLRSAICVLVMFGALSSPALACGGAALASLGNAQSNAAVQMVTGATVLVWGLEAIAAAGTATIGAPLAVAIGVSAVVVGLAVAAAPVLSQK